MGASVNPASPDNCTGPMCSPRTPAPTTRGSTCRLFRAQVSDPGETGLDPLIPLLDRPQIERKRGEVVDLGDRTRVERQVDRLHVPLAGVARFDTHSRVLGILEVGQLLRGRFPACRTPDA